MGIESKTLDGWCEFSECTGRESSYDYFRIGDIVLEDIVDNFINIMPPRAMSHGYLQVGEMYNHVYDILRALRPTLLLQNVMVIGGIMETVLLMKPLIEANRAS